MLCGGVARNVGFVSALQETLGLEALHVPAHAEYVGALGASLIAAERAGARPAAVQQA